MANDTAHKHLIDIITHKEKPVSDAARMYVKRQTELYDKDPERQKDQAFILLQKAIEARDSGQEIEFSISTMNYKSTNPTQKQDEPTLMMVEASRNNALAAAFQFQSLSNTSQVQAMGGVLEKALTEIKGAYRDSTQVEAMKMILQSMNELFKNQQEEIKSLRLEISKYQNEIRDLLKSEKKRHYQELGKDLENLQERGILQQHIKALEDFIENNGNQDQALNEPEKEKEEEDKQIIDGLTGQISGAISQFEGVLGEVGKAKRLIRTVKDLLGGDNETENKADKESAVKEES